MGSKSRKLSLLGTIFVSMLSICSAAVSTFAWFQANANVNIQASSTSTSISVSKPDDYAFYAYVGNKTRDHTVQNSFSSDFVEITSSNVSAQTSLNGLNPGDVMTFCLVVNSHDISENVSLSITEITSNDAHMENSSYNRYIYNTTTDINIGWAINIYATYATSNASSAYATFVSSTTGKTTSNSSDGTDLFTYTNNNRSTYLAGTTTNNVITLNNSISLFNQSINSETIYLYYSVVFTNVNSTLYREVDSTGESLLVPSAETTRRFIAYDANDESRSLCNSNCYQGLTFALNSLSFSF